jgi:hypothetical protein
MQLVVSQRSDGLFAGLPQLKEEVLYGAIVFSTKTVFMGIEQAPLGRVADPGPGDAVFGF